MEKGSWVNTAAVLCGSGGREWGSMDSDLSSSFTAWKLQSSWCKTKGFHTISIRTIFSLWI